MILRILLGEGLNVTRRIPSHISKLDTKIGQFRLFVKFPKLFEKQKPEILYPESLDLHDHTTGFTNFLKSLDSLVSTNQLTIDSFISLFEKFDISISEDNDQLLDVLGSYDSKTLILMLDSITFYSQYKYNRNVVILLNDICSILSKRDLIIPEVENSDTTLTVLLLSVLNRINSNSREVKSLIDSVNSQVRSHSDLLIENGVFTHFLNLFSYILDPKSIYTIIHCCLFKLDRFKHSDYSNLPSFLFNFKIHDGLILRELISYASDSPISVFEENRKSFRNFVKGLILFDTLYNSSEISYRPVLVYLKELNDKLPSYDHKELLFILSGIPEPNKIIDLDRKVYSELVEGILIKIGVNSEKGKFKSLSHLDNRSLISFLTYVNKIPFETNGPEWSDLKPILLNSESLKSLDDLNLSKKEVDNFYFNEVGKELSSRLLKEIPNDSNLEEVDGAFKELRGLETILLLLDTLYLHNVDKIYINSLTLSIRRLLSLLANSKMNQGFLQEFFDKISKLNVKILTEFGMELYRMASPRDPELFEKALTFKFLHLSKNKPLANSELLEDFKHFEALKNNLNRSNFMILLKVLNLIEKVSRFCGSELKSELDELFKRFGDLAYDSLEKDLGLMNHKTVSLLLNLTEECPLLKKIDDLTNSESSKLKIPQMVNVFLFRFQRGTKKCSNKSLEKIHDMIVNSLEEMTNILEKEFSQRVWLYEKGEERKIRKINPWANENGLKSLMRGPSEHFDMFLYEKCPKLDSYFTLYRYNDPKQYRNTEEPTVTSLHDLKMELIDLNKRIIKIEMENYNLYNIEDLTHTMDLLKNLGSKVRRTILAVEMCRPISRNQYLPKKHTKELVKLSLKMFLNEKETIRN